MSVIYKRVALIGLGLIAGSMAYAMRRAGVAEEITGYAHSQETRDAVREIGFCDTVYDSAAAACEGADLVVLAVPVGAMGRVAAEIAPSLAHGCTVTDVGSVKRDESSIMWCGSGKRWAQMSMRWTRIGMIWSCLSQAIRRT